MKLNWNESKSEISSLSGSVEHAVESVIHSADIESTSDAELKLAVIGCVDKATSLLSVNIEDDSRYLMFEWDVDSSMLTVVVTDDSKSSDSKHIVQCTMSSLCNEMTGLKAGSKADWEIKVQENSELIRDWIHNYLTTCGSFMQFSLVAIFHNESREKTRLL